MLMFDISQCPYSKTHRRKEGEGCCYQSITQEVRLSSCIFPPLQGSRSISGLRKRRFLTLGFALLLYFLMQFKVV
jgi:hypothetical protein